MIGGMFDLDGLSLVLDENNAWNTLVLERNSRFGLWRRMNIPLKFNSDRVIHDLSIIS